MIYKHKPCPECDGEKLLKLPALMTPYPWTGLPVHCPICNGTGTVPAEPVSYCQACGEPVELGLTWCELHKPAADLWQALNPPARSENLVKLIPSDSQPLRGWSSIEEGLENG